MDVGTFEANKKLGDGCALAEDEGTWLSDVPRPADEALNLPCDDGSPGCVWRSRRWAATRGRLM